MQRPGRELAEQKDEGESRGCIESREFERAASAEQRQRKKNTEEERGLGRRRCRHHRDRWWWREKAERHRKARAVSDDSFSGCNHFHDGADPAALAA